MGWIFWTWFFQGKKLGKDENEAATIADAYLKEYYRDLYIEFVVDEHKYFVRDEDDIYLEVPLTITESILGCKKDIPTLYGNVKINIPAGTDSGDKQRIKGKGVNNEFRRHKGDMYIIFKVYTPKKLTRDQKILIEKLQDTPLETDEIKDFTKFTKKNEN